MRGLFEKSPLHPKNFSDRFLLCYGMLRSSRPRCSRQPSGTAKTLPALPWGRGGCGENGVVMCERQNLLNYAMPYPCFVGTGVAKRRERNE